MRAGPLSDWTIDPRTAYTAFRFAIASLWISLSRMEFVFMDSGHGVFFDLTFDQPFDGLRG
jgi:hypothetical protein